MLRASDALEFEKAAKIRDNISALKALSERRRVFNTDNRNTDIIALASSVNTSFVVLLSIRNGKMLNAVDFVMKKHEESSAE